MWKTWFWSLHCDDPLKKGMATHSSILAQRIYSFRILAPRMSQPCTLNLWCKQSIGRAAPFHTPLTLVLDVSGTHQHAADNQSWNLSGPGTAVSPSEVFTPASCHILELKNVWGQVSLAQLEPRFSEFPFLRASKFSAVQCSAKSLQSCPSLCNPVDCSPQGSSVHGILQARILERVAVPSSRGSSQHRDLTCVFWGSCIVGRFFPAEPPGEAHFQVEGGMRCMRFGKQKDSRQSCHSHTTVSHWLMRGSTWLTSSSSSWLSSFHFSLSWARCVFSLAIKDASFSPTSPVSSRLEATRNRHNQQCTGTCQTTSSAGAVPRWILVDIVYDNKQDKSETIKTGEEFHLLICVVSYIFARLKSSFKYQRSISFTHSVTAINIRHF